MLQTRCVRFALAAALLAPLAEASPHRTIPMPDYVQDVWESGDDGLPHPGVSAIRQTPDGYLWITTFGGVTRFDGVEFTTPTVSDPKVQDALTGYLSSILYASDGALWFGTRRAGAVRVKDGAGQIFTPKEGLGHLRVRAIAETGDGSLWFATQAGLSVRDRSGAFRTYLKKDGLPADEITTLFHDADDSLWIGTADYGLARFDGHRFETFVLPVLDLIPEEAFGLPLRAVGAIARDSDGVLWAGTTVGLFRVPERGPVPPEHYPGAVNAIWASAKGGLWVCTSRGLGRYDKGRWRVYSSKEGLITDTLHSVYEDAEGSVWVGSRSGLARLRPRVMQTYTQRDGLGHDNITCVLEARDGVVWAGHRNGVSRLAEGTWTNLGTTDGLPDPSVRTLAETADGSLWIGTLDGLARYKNGHISVYRGEGRPYTVRALAPDPDGGVWISTPYGVDRLEGNAVRRHLPVSAVCNEPGANTMETTSDGSLWVGTSSCLARIRNDKVEILNDPNATNDVRSIFEDAEHRIWVASTTGLSRVTDSGRRPVLKSAMYGVLQDAGGGLWCSTPRGLYHIPRESLESETISTTGAGGVRLFGTADGMDSRVATGGGDPAAWPGRDGRLWFTTASGVSVVYPARIPADTAAPPLHIKRLVADHKVFDYATTPQLPAGTRDVELHFALLTFIAPERVQYKYRLEGHDQAWVESRSRQVAYYTNLHPGHYAFHVIGANHNGIWNEQGDTLEFDVLPRFYEQRWFVPMLVFLALAVAGTVYRVRIAALRAREVQLQRRVDEAVANVQQLRGMLPICASCRRVREDKGAWRQIEAYVMEHTHATFSHGVCPECWEKMRLEDPGLPEYGKTS
jgi:ligand-binding sensor domain-containing protein